MTNEKHPITVTRLKTFTLMGHSNGDGWAGTSPLFNAHGGLQPTSDPTGNPADAYWKNIYVFTSEIPWAGTEGTPVRSFIDDGEWLEMTCSNPTDVIHEHPFPSPFRYPNIRGSCYPNWMHNASPIGGGTTCGIEIPLSYRWSLYWQEQVGMVKLALSSTLFLRNERGGTTTPAAASTWFDLFSYSALSPDNRPGTTVDPSYGFFGWWEPYDDFDWAPSTSRIYRLWFEKMTGAQAALPAGTKMDVRLVIPWLGENDALVREADILEDVFENAVRAFIKRVRHDLVENDWTTLPEEEIPIIWPGLYPAYDAGGGGNAVCAAALARIEADDPYFATFSTAAFSMLSDEGYISTFGGGASTHFGVEGYIEAASTVMDLYEAMQVDPYDALAEETRIEVDEVMDRVRTYYTRARVQTDVDDDTLLVHINGALFHLLNLIGDQAWFLRRRKELELSAGPNTPTTLPKYVHRLLKIEDPGDVTRAVTFEQIGYVDGGRLQVLIKDRIDGDFTCHFITRPNKLTRTTQLVPLPFQMIEWLVIETCRRLSRSSSNVELQRSLKEEAEQMQKDCMRDLGAQQRSRNDRLQGQLKLPNPRLRRRGRSWGRDW